MGENSERGWRRWWPFVALCTFELLRLNLNESISGIGATLASQAVACAIAAVICLIFVLVQGASEFRFGALAKPALAGALFLCGTQAALFLHPRALATSGIAISLALVPVVIAVVSAAGSKAGLSLGELWPGIIAAAGLALMVPEPILTDPLSDLTMLLMLLLTGIGCVLVCHWQVRSCRLHAFAVLFGALVIFACGVVSNVAFFHQALSIPRFRAVACDLVLVTLAVMSIRRLKPAQYSARFVLLSLAALMEGAILFRVWPTFRASIGFAALLISAAALLRNVRNDDVEELSLRRD